MIALIRSVISADHSLGRVKIRPKTIWPLPNWQCNHKNEKIRHVTGKTSCSWSKGNPRREEEWTVNKYNTRHCDHEIWKVYTQTHNESKNHSKKKHLTNTVCMLVIILVKRESEGGREEEEWTVNIYTTRPGTVIMNYGKVYTHTATHNRRTIYSKKKKSSLYVGKYSVGIISQLHIFQVEIYHDLPVFQKTFLKPPCDFYLPVSCQ